MGFINPTPVQAETIPLALEGRDVLGTAQTGTGKTGAFGIPLITFLDKHSKLQALVLAPTRELAAQIHQVLGSMGKGLQFRGALLVGGESFNRQVSDLRKGTDFIVATPGRLNDHLEQGTVSLSYVGMLVLDEVDRMLDMGFAPQIKRIMTKVPKERLTLLFSATLPTEITNLASSLLKNPERVAVGSISQPIALVSEATIRTTNEGKNSNILREVKERQGRILIFIRTKTRADRVAKLLSKEGHRVALLHGDRSQGQRKQALERFKNGTCRIMVATDLAGRGIDVEDIDHVINYDVPSSREDYIHRLGRTGRLGKTGCALNLLITGDMDGERVISGEKPITRTVFRSRRFGRRR